MINANMRLYDFLTLGEDSAYGQPQIPTLDSFEPTGQIKMAIHLDTQSIVDNINYTSRNYIGLTKDTVDDTYIINYENRLLKVLYVNPNGRLKQVYMSEL